MRVILSNKNWRILFTTYPQKRNFKASISEAMKTFHKESERLKQTDKIVLHLHIILCIKQQDKLKSVELQDRDRMNTLESCAAPHRGWGHFESSPALVFWTVKTSPERLPVLVWCTIFKIAYKNWLKCYIYVLKYQIFIL